MSGERLHCPTMQNQAAPLTYRKIFFFWVPLAATWLMMATEGPFLAAVIARLAEPKYNLAAYGVAFSFAVLIEAPIIMIMSAATALVKDRDSLAKLRNFAYALNAGVTGIMLLFITPPIFYFITTRLMGLPDNITQLTHTACIIMLPWPAAIGFRRFFQGVLIRSNLTRRVAYGTAVRLTTMATVSLFCYLFLELRGALVGALALSCSVTLEALATRWMAHQSLKELKKIDPDPEQAKSLTYKYIGKFYYPLALTSILSLGIYPMVTFFMGQSRMSLESLAVLPVVNSLVFIFRSMGLSFQEVGIALMDNHKNAFFKLRNFVLVLSLTVTGGLSLVAFTPLSVLWFNKVSGLSIELTRFALTPTRILCLIPALSVVIAFQRAILVTHKKTTPVTVGTAIEVSGIFVILLLTLQGLGLIGAVGAALALITGRVLANIYLFRPCTQALASDSS